MKTAYNNHKASAKQRGIEFLMTYQEWLGIWTDSGKLLGRGRGAKEYCMARMGDSGPYAVGNVFICTNAQNAADASSNGCYMGAHKRGASAEQLAAIKSRKALAAPKPVVDSAQTYREAVRLAWSLRTPAELTRQQLASEAGLYPQHVTDYLHPDDHPKRRDLPAQHIHAFNTVVGNTLVSQWLAHLDGLTILEEVQATRAAA